MTIGNIHLFIFIGSFMNVRGYNLYFVQKQNGSMLKRCYSLKLIISIKKETRLSNCSVYHFSIQVGAGSVTRVYCLAEDLLRFLNTSEQMSSSSFQLHSPQHSVLARRSRPVKRRRRRTCQASIHSDLIKRASPQKR